MEIIGIHASGISQLGLPATVRNPLPGPACMDNVRATNHTRPKLVFPALRLGRTGDAMHHFLALLRTGVFSDHTDAHAIPGKTVCPPAEQAGFQVAVADVGQVLIIRRTTADIGGGDHGLLQAQGHCILPIGQPHTRQGRQSACQRTGYRVRLFAIVAIPYPAKAHTIGILPIGTDEQIVIPGKPQRGSHRHGRQRDNKKTQARQTGQQRRGHNLLSTDFVVVPRKHTPAAMSETPAPLHDQEGKRCRPGNQDQSIESFHPCH